MKRFQTSSTYLIKSLPHVADAVLLMFGVVFICLFACNLNASELVIAQTQDWNTQFVFSSKTGARFPASACTGLQVVDIPANGTAVVDKAGSLQCGLIGGIGTFTVPIGTEAVSVLSYRDITQFSVPPITPVLSRNGDAGEIPRIINRGSTGTYVAFINTDPSPHAVTIEVYDGQNRYVATEYVMAERGAVLYALQTPLDAGRLVVTEGNKGFSAAPQGGLLYVFAAIGPANGKTQRIEVLR